MHGSVSHYVLPPSVAKRSMILLMCRRAIFNNKVVLITEKFGGSLFESVSSLCLTHG